MRPTLAKCVWKSSACGKSRDKGSTPPTPPSLLDSKPVRGVTVRTANRGFRGRGTCPAALRQLRVAALALSQDLEGTEGTVHSMTTAAVRSPSPRLGQDELAVFARSVLLGNRRAALSGMTGTAQCWNLVWRRNLVGFRMPLRTSVVDTGPMTRVAIQPVFGMGMREEVGDCVAVAHLAEVAGFLAGNECNPKKQG